MNGPVNLSAEPGQDRDQYEFHMKEGKFPHCVMQSNISMMLQNSSIPAHTAIASEAWDTRA